VTRAAVLYVFSVMVDDMIPMNAGTSRTIRFRKSMECAILASHRRVQPFGIAGGEPGELGRTSVRRLDGRIDELKGCDQTVLEAGEAVTVIKPTGGGYGAA